jgi:hypothetical protein
VLNRRSGGILSENNVNPCTLTLFKRDNFLGVQQDRETAYTLHPHEPDQRRLVDTMWVPLETKYPAYATYLESQPKK